MIFTPREAKPSLNTCYHSYNSFYRHIIHYRVPPARVLIPWRLALQKRSWSQLATRVSGELLSVSFYSRPGTSAARGGAGRGVPGRPAGSGLRTLTVTRAARERRRGLAPVPRGSAGAGAGVATLRLTRRPGRPGRRGSAGVGRL